MTGCPLWGTVTVKMGEAMVTSQSIIMTLRLQTETSLASLSAPTIHRLSNGLTIIAEQMPVDAVNLSIWLGVGSAVESDAINGMAHYLEHMIFKGTQEVPSGEFERQVERRGAVMNAATSQDYTHYHITTAPADFADLAPLQVEVVLNAAIPDDAFERERSVILEEIRRANDNPRRRNFYRSMEAGFDHLPYRRPVLGWDSIVQHLTPQQMRDFHSTWYQPQSMTAVAVGNLPVDTLVQQVADSFEQARPWAAIAPLSPLDAALHTSFARVAHLDLEAPFAEIQRREYVDSTLQQARLTMMWRVPGMADAYQTYALDVLAYILGHGRMARMFQDLREEQGLVSRISASNITYARQGLFFISAQLPVEHLDAVEKAIAQHIADLQNTPVQDSEINRVRTLVANHHIFGNETPGNRAGLYGYYQAVVGDITPALNYPARIRALDPIDLQNAAQRHLASTAYGIVISRPD
jgi:zinc protease